MSAAGGIGTSEAAAAALLVACGLCGQPPGESCVNSVSGEIPRREPHMSRVVRGRLADRGE